MAKTKMPRKNRAVQFIPFDAVKGLREALLLVEIEHEKTIKGEISEEQAEKISSTFINISNNSIVKLVYFLDGYEKNYQGKIKVDIFNQIIFLDNKKIPLNSIRDIYIITM